jgi:periplasmic protein TonB
MPFPSEIVLTKWELLSIGTEIPPFSVVSRKFLHAGNQLERRLICSQEKQATEIASSIHSRRGHHGGAMPTSEVHSNSSGEPELHLLLAPHTYQPLWRSLFRQLDDFLFPEKLPPLTLESKPEPVKDIWGLYNYKKDGVLGSAGLHIFIAGVIVAATATWTRPTLPPASRLPVEIVYSAETPALQPGKTQSGGGGGGGTRDVLKVSAGRLPTRSLRQIAPPEVILRPEQHKLEVESTIVIPPEVLLVASNNFPNFGDPMSHLTMPSNGQGERGGMGDTGSRGGIGPGDGAGYGPGGDGGVGGDTYHRGQGASDPRVLSQVDPEFSEEARKAKFQGLCVLSLIIEPDGTPSNIRVKDSLGMGLDEKAIEAVRKWRFQPSMKNGRPVRYGPVEVDVDFHLY